jgi:hypothetical protein
VIRLVASADVALSRRPEMTREEINRRIAAVRSLRFPEQTMVTEVDSDQSLAEVSRQIHSLVWKVL